MLHRSALLFNTPATAALLPAGLAMLDFFRDLWDFLRTRKKVWMLPIILLMVLLGGLIIVSQQSVLGSFIYTLF